MSAEHQGISSAELMASGAMGSGAGGGAGAGHGSAMPANGHFFGNNMDSSVAPVSGSLELGSSENFDPKLPAALGENAFFDVAGESMDPFKVGHNFNVEKLGVGDVGAGNISAATNAVPNIQFLRSDMGAGAGAGAQH